MEAFFMAFIFIYEIDFIFVCIIFVSNTDFLMMKPYLLALLLLFNVHTGFSQSKKLWKGYFSFNEIKDLSEGESKITAATENALFTKDLINGNVKTANTVDGLSGQTITSIHYSSQFKKTLIGYENGLMIVVNDADGSILNVVDIIQKSIAPNIKRINHFMEYEGLVYLSCDFGIVQFNLSTLQFGDTYFIGDNGAQIKISQTAVFQNKIYAATIGYGIRSADISNANLNDYNQWTSLDNSSWSGVEAFGTNLMAVTASGQIFRSQGGTFSPFTSLNASPLDFRKNGNYLIATTSDRIFIYNLSLGLVRTVVNTEILDLTVKFNCATVIGTAIYAGTVENGLFTTEVNETTFENITPSGPVRNNIFAIATTSKDLWAVYGGYDLFYNPYGYLGISLPSTFSVSKLKSDGWLEIPYRDLLGAKALSRIVVNPANENQVFIGSYDSGVLKIEDEVPTVLYNQTNSALRPPATFNTIRVGGLAYDDSSNLWITNSLINNALVVQRANGQWASYDISAVLSNVDNFGRLTIDKNGTKWLSSRDNGLIAFNETVSQTPKSITSNAEKGELPSSDVRVTAVDKRNQLWIGTVRGLRVLSSVDAFLSEEQMKPERIVIQQEDAEELLYLQSITDIVVDGSNNKWIGTADAGVFYLSSDGQKTIYQFNTNNSPLPSNSVNDIDINGLTGEVFIATQKGMVSFNGIATSANDNLNSVYIFPNPVRPEFSGTVKISGLTDKANIKIADIEGNLVYETFAEGGTIEWDTTAFGKYKVASGVYMVLISSGDGLQTKVKKVMIIR